MPKKRNHQFKPTQNQISRHTSSRDSPGPSKTVNERLSQLRAEQAPRPTIEQRNEITTLATSHTLPPHLRRILDVPETAPPAPKRGSRRIMTRVNGQRLPPGPAAPQSWLAASLHAPASVRARARKAAQDAASARNVRQLASKITALEDVHPLPRAGSLLDFTLKTMAFDWDFIAEYEQLNLATLPIRWKTALLSYLGTYAPVGSISSASLKTLFLTQDELSEATGGEDLVRLDMEGILSEAFNLADLERFLTRKRDHGVTLDQQTDGLALEPAVSKTDTSDDVAESWEDEASADVLPSLFGIKMKRFPNLTRLSLSNPGRQASWKQLLSLTADLSALTHLSLAFWPVPTTTPNSKTAFITHNHASIPVSGTHFYNRLDGDWAEAASILKRLSRNTYRLQWLDLEGCADWLPALTWSPDEEQGQRDRWVDRTFGRANRASRESNASMSTDDDFEGSPSFFGPDWTGSWSQLAHVDISQGIIPRDVSSVRAYPAGVVAAELLLWLRDEENTKDEDLQRSKGMDVQQWLQREKEARTVERTVRALRSSAGGVYCEFDHGWKRPVAAAAAVFKSSKIEG